MVSKRELVRIQIQTLRRQGWTVREVSRKLRVAEGTVQKWTNRKTYKHHFNTKHVPKLSPNTKKKITSRMKDKVGASVRRCAKELNMSLDYKNRSKTISKSSIHSYIKTEEWGKFARKLIAKPLLSELNTKDRLRFAQKVQTDGYCDDSRIGRELRENTLWTDESPVLLHPMPNKQTTRVYTTDKSLTICPVPKKSIHIMVAGGITSRGKTELYICEPKETINGNVYENKILPIYLKAIDNRDLIRCRKKATLQQDSAPGHNTKSVIKKIEATFQHSWTKGVWPGNSPDLNVIEHVWSVLQNSVFIAPKPKTREQLITRVMEAWNSLDADYLSNLVHSFSERIAQVIDNLGGHTTY